jgi:hypothetical protein
MQTAIKVTKIIFRELPCEPALSAVSFLSGKGCRCHRQFGHTAKLGSRLRLLTPFCRPAQAPAASGLPRRPHAALLVNPSARITAGTCYANVGLVKF